MAEELLSEVVPEVVQIDYDYMCCDELIYPAYEYVQQIRIGPNPYLLGRMVYKTCPDCGNEVIGPRSFESETEAHIFRAGLETYLDEEENEDDIFEKFRLLCESKEGQYIEVNFKDTPPKLKLV